MTFKLIIQKTNNVAYLRQCHPGHLRDGRQVGVVFRYGPFHRMAEDREDARAVAIVEHV